MKPKNSEFIQVLMCHRQYPPPEKLLQSFLLNITYQIHIETRREERVEEEEEGVKTFML